MDPVDAQTIEDVWKPNESFINRKVNQVIDKIKEVRQNFIFLSIFKAIIKNMTIYYILLFNLKLTDKKLMI